MMKKILSRTVSIALAMLLTVSCLSGCGSKSVNTAEYLGTYSTDVTSLIPFYLPDTTGKKVISNVIDGLIETDRFGAFVPSLAESWEHNDDYSVWTFHLRKDAKWYDSKGAEVAPVTAQDFVDGMRFVADHKKTKSDMSIIKSVIAGLGEYYDTLVDFDDPNLTASKKPEGPREKLEAQFDDAVGVKALDEYTVQYTLTAPVPYFESFLVTEIFLPNHKEFSDQCDTKFGTSPDQLLYCGAYILQSWQRNKEFVMVKNENYYDADKVSVEKIVLQKITDGAATVEMFKRGELTGTSLTGDQVEHYMQDPEWGQYVTLRDKSSVNFWFFPNFESPNSEFNAFVQNEDFRLALYHALDRVTIAQLYNPYDTEDILTNLICPEDVCYDENGIDYTDYAPLKEIKERGAATYDPALTKEYFEKALSAVTDGSGNIRGASAGEVKMGRTFSFQTDGKLPLQLVYVHGASSDEVSMAQIIKMNLEEVFGSENIEVILSQFTGDKYNDVIAPGNFDFAYDNYSFKYADPLSQLDRLTTGGAVNDGRYSLPQFDALVKEASEKLVASERYELFAQAEGMLIDGGYIIPWESGGGTYGMTREIPFTAPRGGFGLSRFKYKGMQLSEEPISAEQYKQLEDEFYEQLLKRNAG